MGKKSKKNNAVNSVDEIPTDLGVLKFAEQVTRNKYQRELDVESGIIAQAGQMQAAFSFVTAAILMTAPVACEYRGEKISLNLILAIFAVISVAMVCSLVFATLAHQRRKHNEEEDAGKLNDYILENKKWFKDEKYRVDYLTKTYIELQSSMAQINETRLKWLRASTYSFYVAIALCVLGFIVYVLNM